MKQVRVATRSQWRRWLAENHDQEKDGIWLVFHRKETGQASLDYEESVEEALCFGWIDSIIKRIDGFETLAPSYRKHFLFTFRH